MAVVTDLLGARHQADSRVIAWDSVRWLPLALILVAQALLTVRLIHPNYASGDEGRYIYAGHQLIYQLWHGGGSPYYETYFSGAPVIYPVLAAMVDHVGGLAAVRLMSLLFMLTATGMLFAAAKRLFGYSSAVLAAALFAGLGLTQDLGALATYDAMSLMLMTVAAYCAVRTKDGEPNVTFWLLVLPVVLLVANCTKYVTMVFDPVIIALSALQVGGGWRRVITRFTALAAATGVALALALFLAGGAYLKGALFSTFARKAGTNVVFAIVKQPTSMIALESWRWIGVTLAGSVLAFVAAACFRKDWKAAAIVALFMLAGLLVTVEGLHLHTDESMRKHDDFSAWFACAAAGSITSYVRFQARYVARLITAAFVLFVAAVSGIHYSGLARTTFEAGGSKVTLEVAAAVRPYLNAAHGRYLVGGFGDDQLLYLDHVPVPWYRNFDDLYIKYPIPGRGGDSHGQAPGLACFQLKPECVYLEGIAGYRAAIQAHWFWVICMWGSHGTRQDAQIEQAVRHTPGYVLLNQVDRAPTWIYAPAYRHLPTVAYQARAPTEPAVVRHRPAVVRHRPAVVHHAAGALTILRGVAITMAPSAVYLAAGLLLVGGVTWRRRIRSRRRAGDDVGWVPTAARERPMRGRHAASQYTGPRPTVGRSGLCHRGGSRGGPIRS